MTYDDVRAIALELPDVEEGITYGTAAVKVRGKLFIRLKGDGETIVLRTQPIERDHLVRDQAKILYITDHYRDYPWVLVRLDKILRPLSKELIEGAYRRVSPRRASASSRKPGRTPSTRRREDG